jgi:tetratricopeptide (TPR) repeat protein
MAMHGLWALVCAGAVVAATPPAPPDQAEKQDALVKTALRVQLALQQARERVAQNDFRTAVFVLEDQLPYCNGNAVYLKLLQDAYRGYIKELHLAKQEAEVQRYAQRLLVLDRGALLDSSVTGVRPGSGAPIPTPNGPQKTVRLKSDDEATAGPHVKEGPNKEAQAILAQAEKKFGERRYQEARLLYEQAYQSDREVVENCRKRWAYCKLFHVVEQLNRAASGSLAWNDLEDEVRLAQTLAPDLEYARTLLKEIENRRYAGGKGADAKSAGAVAVQHQPRSPEGWQIAETANFRIFHNQSREYAEQAADVAERTRANMQQKWFGALNEPWTPKCDLFLHNTGQDYNRATGQYNSPGHSTIKIENGRLVIRRIDLHCDDPNLMTAVLPHEATHVVLAGEFGEQMVPRWADEGIAVLTEPREKIERHLVNLNRCRQDNLVIPLRDLMQLDDYPKNPRYIGAFYAESVALVEFLSSQRGPQTFTIFLNEGLRYGYEKALKREYGFNSFAELEQQWLQYTQRDRVASR